MKKEKKRLKKRFEKVLSTPPLPKKIPFKYKLKFLMKKAQTAMEYILTYGWAILIILFALSSLFYIGVFEPKTPNTCLIEAPFICNDIIAYDDTVVYTLSSQNIKSATVTDILINGQSCSILEGSLITNPGIKTFDVNSQNQILCIGLGQDLYKKISSEIILEYESQQGLQHTITGTSSANIEGEGSEVQVDYTYNPDPDIIFAMNFENGFEMLGQYPNDPLVEGHEPEIRQAENIGNVAYFEDTYIEIGSQPILNSDLATIEFLIKFLDPSPTMERPIFVKRSENKFNYGFYFEEMDKVLIFRVRTTEDCITTVRSNTLNLNEWYHVAGVFDGNKIFIYINGEKVNEGIPCSSSIIQDSIPIFIGTDALKSSYFRGSLDSIVLYSDDLSPKEIKKHYEHFTPP